MQYDLARYVRYLAVLILAIFLPLAASAHLMPHKIYYHPHEQLPVPFYKGAPPSHHHPKHHSDHPHHAGVYYLSNDIVLDLNSGSLAIHTIDNRFSFAIHGYLIINHSFLSGAYNVDGFGKPHFGQLTQLLYARLGFYGHAYDFGYGLQFSNTVGPTNDNKSATANSTISDNDSVFIREAYITYLGFHHFIIFAGKALPYFGVDNMADEYGTYGASFTMLTNAFAPPTALGVMLHSFFPHFTFTAGIFDTGNVNLSSATTQRGAHGYQNETIITAARFGWIPFFNPDYTHVLYLQLSGYVSQGNPNQARQIRVNSGVHGTLIGDAVAPVTSGFFGLDTRQGEVNVIDAGLAYLSGPFSAEAEYASMRDKITNAPRDDHPTYQGGYIQFGYVIAGGHRVFDPHDGYLRGVLHPHGRWGAFEIILRGEILDLESKAGPKGMSIGTIGRTLTVGLDWYITQNVRAVFDYTHLCVTGPDAAVNNGNGGNLQVSFAI